MRMEGARQGKEGGKRKRGREKEGDEKERQIIKIWIFV